MSGLPVQYARDITTTPTGQGINVDGLFIQAGSVGPLANGNTGGPAGVHAGFLYNTAVSSSAPNDKDILTYDAGAMNWKSTNWPTLQDITLTDTMPTMSSQVVTKGYVDAAVSGIHFHPNVNVYADPTSMVVMASTYTNGSADTSGGLGIGATLTDSTTGTVLVVDTITLSINQRVLVNGFSGGNSIYNGVYYVSQLGVTGSQQWILTRATDSDNHIAGQVMAGDTVFVSNGSMAYKSTTWVQIDVGTGTPTGTIKIGTDPINWTQIGAAGSGVTSFSAGTTGFLPNTNTGGMITLSGTANSSSGGTGLSGWGTNLNQLLASGTIASGPAQYVSGTSGLPLVSTGTGTLPNYAQLNIASGTNVSGTLSVANGGSGLSSLGSANQILGVNAGDTALEYKSLVAGNGINIMYPMAGQINIALTAFNPSTINLTNNHVLVGNATNMATDVPMTGDVNIINTGATTLVSVDALPIKATTGANSSIYFGYSSTLPTGLQNVGIGYQSLNVATGTQNTAIGYGAGSAITTGINNTLLGSGSSTGATNNNTVVIGQGSSTVSTGDTIIGQGITSLADDAVAIGRAASIGASGTGAIVIGVTARANAANTIIIGQNAGNITMSGTQNVGIGSSVLSAITSGGSNTTLGFQAGNTLTTGSNNTLLGNGAQPSSATISNEITFGNSSITLIRAVGSSQFGTNVVATAGQNSHAGGQADTAGHIISSGTGSYAVGRSTATSFITSSGLGSYAGGYAQNTSIIQSTGNGSYVYGATLNVGSLNATALGSSVMGYSESTSGTGITSSNFGSRAQGYTSSYGTITSSGLGSHAEGYSLLTQGALGNGLIASGNGSHVEGYAIGTNGTIQATGIGSHAEGYASTGSISIASGIGSHVEGQNVKASGIASHAQGYADPGGILQATGLGSHAQGSSKLSGQIFITGEDPEFHCQGEYPPSVVLLQTGMNYSMGGTLGQHINKILWVESYQQPLPSGHLYGYNCFPFLSTSLGITLVMGSAPITNVVGSGVTVTYTCANNFTAGQTISILGVFPTAYNLTNVTIATRTATQFTVTNAAIGTYQQGGYVRNPAAGDYDIVDNLGFREVTLADYRTIAIASTFGSMLRTAELNSLGARFSDITAYIAAGGGIYANAENNDLSASTTAPHTAAITNAVGNGVTVTYTSANTFVAGEIVNITGINPGAYNLTGVTIASRTPTQFTVTNAATGAFVSGGTASAPHIPYFSWFPGGGSVSITTPSPPYTPTAFGISLGLNSVDLNGISHNSFLTFPASLAIVAIDSLSHAMALATTGNSTIQATNDGSSAGGSIFGVGAITASGLGAFAQGRCVSSGSIVASGDGSHAEGYAAFAQQNTASGLGSHVEGQNCTAGGIASHAQGCNNTASGNYSHAAGYSATASADYSYAWSDGTPFTNNTVGRYAIRAGGQVLIDNGATTTAITLTYNNQTTWSYLPGIPANWSTVPNNVAQALDLLSAKVTSVSTSIPALVIPNNFNALQKGIPVGGLYRSALNAATSSSTFAITASFVTAGTTLTVIVTAGYITPGMFLTGGTVTAGTQILAQLTGTAGAAGTYQVDTAQLIGVAPTGVIYNSIVNPDTIYVRTV